MWTKIGNRPSLEEKKPTKLNMSIRNRKPIKGLKVGDKVSSKKLKDHNLSRDSPMLKQVKTWTVESLTVSKISLMKGKKRITEEKTVLVLVNGKGDKQKRKRTFWIN